MGLFDGKKSGKNLREAFAGEARLRNRYAYFAQIAKAEGLEQVATIFADTAERLQEQAKMHLKLVEGIGDTRANLTAASAGLDGDWAEQYGRMAAEAKAEGFDDLADHFAQMAKAELATRERYRRLLGVVSQGVLFKKPEPKPQWVCQNRRCGYVLEAEKAPEHCPVCKHPESHFVRKS